MMQTTSKPLLSLLTLITLGLIWGTGYSIARFAMTNGVPPLGYSFWQSLGPAVLIGVICLLRARRFPIDLRYRYFYLIAALTGIVIPNTTMYFAASHLPASTLAIIVNTVPVVAYPLALLTRLETFHWQRLLGVLLGFCGLLFVILPPASLPSSEMTPWLFITLITPFSFALCSIYIARFRPPTVDSLNLAAGMLSFSSLLLIPLVLQTNSFYWFHYPLLTADWVVLLEIVLSSIGYVLFFQLLKMAGPVFYSLVDSVVVITGVAWGYFIFSEHLTRWTAVAVCLILIALLLVTRYQRRANHD
jgi:drug/metabolite transporter (DMT)-like permease